MTREQSKISPAPLVPRDDGAAECATCAHPHGNHGWSDNPHACACCAATPPSFRHFSGEQLDELRRELLPAPAAPVSPQ